MISLINIPPTKLALYSMILTVPLCMSILYLAKPRWIHRTYIDGETKLSWQLITSISLAFSFLFAVGVLLFTNYYKIPPKLKAESSFTSSSPPAAAVNNLSEYPSPNLIMSYCSKKHT